jgi:hypothetical protein
MSDKRSDNGAALGVTEHLQAQIAEETHQKKLPSSLIKIISDIPQDELITVIHYAIRLLHRRESISSVSKGLIVPGLSGEPDERAQKYAERIIQCIEKIEGVRLQDLSEERSDSYIVALSMQSNPHSFKGGKISPGVKRQLELLNSSMSDLNA